MSSSPEMSVFHLRINQGLLDCTYCRRTLRPETYNDRAYTCRQCVRGQIYCRDCIRRHHCGAADTYSTCDLLNDIIAQMKFKCDCKKYIPYCEFLEHRRECPSAKYSTHPAQWKCILKTSCLQCSECEVPVWPPVFSLWCHNRLICSACYRADIGTYRHCTELEYLLQGITVKCVACKQYLPFSTLGSHQVGDCLKRKLQNIAPGSSARKKFCDEDETKRPMVGSNSIHGAPTPAQTGVSLSRLLPIAAPSKPPLQPKAVSANKQKAAPAAKAVPPPKEATKKAAKKQPPPKKAESSSSEEDSSESEEEVKVQPKKAAVKPVKQESSDESSDETTSDEEPAKKPAAKPAAPVANNGARQASQQQLQF